MTSTNTAEKTWDEYVAAANAHPAPPARRAAQKMVKKVQADQSTKDAVEFLLNPPRLLKEGMNVDALMHDYGHRLWAATITSIGTNKVKLVWVDQDATKQKTVPIYRLRHAIHREVNLCHPRCETGQEMDLACHGEQDENLALQKDLAVSLEDEDDFDLRRTTLKNKNRCRKQENVEAAAAAEKYTWQMQVAEHRKACETLGLKTGGPYKWLPVGLDRKQEERGVEVDDLDEKAQKDGYLTKNSKPARWAKTPPLACHAVKEGRLVYVKEQRGRGTDGKMVTERFVGTVIGFHPAKRLLRVVNRQKDDASPESPFWLHQLDLKDLAEASREARKLETLQKKSPGRDVFAEAAAAPVAPAPPPPPPAAPPAAPPPPVPAVHTTDAADAVWNSFLYGHTGAPPAPAAAPSAAPSRPAPPPADCWDALFGSDSSDEDWSALRGRSQPIARKRKVGEALDETRQ